MAPRSVLPHGHLHLLRQECWHRERGDTLPLWPHAVQDEVEVPAPDVGADLPGQLRCLGEHGVDAIHELRCDRSGRRCRRLAARRCPDRVPNWRWTPCINLFFAVCAIICGLLLRRGPLYRQGAPAAQATTVGSSVIKS